MAVLDLDVVAEVVPLVVAVEDAEVVTLVVSEVVAEVVTLDDADELADVVAEEDTDVVTLLEADVVTDELAVEVTDVVAVELTLVVAVDETDDDAVDESEVVADVVTLDVTVLVCVEVCVVCLHSKKDPSRCPLMALLTRSTVAAHVFTFAIMKPSIVQSSVESLAPNLSAKIALPAILFRAVLTVPHSLLDAPAKI